MQSKILLGGSKKLRGWPTLELYLLFIGAYGELIAELEQIGTRNLPSRGKVETLSARLETLTNLLVFVLTGDPKKVSSMIKELGTLYAAVEQRSDAYESPI